MIEEVVLVNTNDEIVGTIEKMEAHQRGLLHRAFSIFLFNNQNELLLQRRAHYKYHSGGLWTNTCCSHPKLKETVLEAAARRLMEEMGIQAQMTPSFSFIYKADFDNGLTEHELDHVLIGKYSGQPNINKDEVAEWKYMPMKAIKTDIESNPDTYAAWFKIVFDRVHDYIHS